MFYKMRWFFLCVVLFIFNFVFGHEQKCGNDSPHLSCGLHLKTRAACEKSGCCWDADATAQCFTSHIYGYHYHDVSQEIGVGQLELNDVSGMFGTDYSTLNVQISQETETRTHIKISPEDSISWEVPETLIPRPGGIYTGSDALTSTEVVTSDEGTEIFTRRKLTNDVIFQLNKNLVFQEQYIQFSLTVPEGTVATFGLGESSRLTQHLVENTTYTLWNTDCPAAQFENSLYGSHPFFIQVAADGQAHGVFLLNSNAMDVTYMDSPLWSKKTLDYQLTGGILDLYILAGSTPADVVRQYLDIIGRPAMMPYWSFGFHNCRWGYPDVSYVMDVVTNYSAANIPLETQWLDIDYMDQYLDFTLDPVNFSQDDMNVLVRYLKAHNQSFVPIIDPAISMMNPSYSAYTDGMDQNVFVKDLHGSNPYLGQVWPGPVHFPDWFAENTTSYWEHQLADLYSLVEYDGIWIDMNEVSNFCNYGGGGQVCYLRDKAECRSNVCCLHCETVDDENPLDFPPFVPNVFMHSLGGRTLPMSSKHAGDIPEYYVHNLHGLMESIATNLAIKNIREERPFVLSRSTFAGSGRHTAHWTGDNAATWDDLAVSIITMNNLGLFGITMVGADICGFQGVSNEELCARWIQVGAFSPFSRNHNIRKAAPQELYRWESVASTSRDMLSLRYKLLPHLYTLMYEAHASGNVVLNALWVNFPEYASAFFQDGQYMWSNTLLFTPVLTEGATSVTGFFPPSIWYSMTDNSLINHQDVSSDGSFFVALSTGLMSTNVHVRGGSVVPMQESEMTVSDSRASPFTLLLALDGYNAATGSLFLDDGVQRDLDHVSRVEYAAEQKGFTSTLVDHTYLQDNPVAVIDILTTSTQPLVNAHGYCEALLVINNSGVSTVVTGQVVSHQDNAFRRITFSLVDNNIRLPVLESYQFSWTC